MGHHDGDVIFPHFVRACLLLACLLAKPVRSTLDTKEGYKTKTGSTSSATLTLAPLRNSPTLVSLLATGHLLVPFCTPKTTQIGYLSKGSGQKLPNLVLFSLIFDAVYLLPGPRALRAAQPSHGKTQAAH